MKKFISVLLVVCMIVGFANIIVIAADKNEITSPSIPTTGDVWDGTILQPSELVEKMAYIITKLTNVQN